MSHSPTVLVLGPVITRADVPDLCERLRELMRDGGRGGGEVVCDLSAVTRPDLVVVEALARLRLMAIRYGRPLRLQGAVPRLRELLVLTGLDQVLDQAPDQVLDEVPDQGCGVTATGLPVGVVRQTEQREQPGGVEERVDPDDSVA